MTDNARPEIIFRPANKGMEKFCGTLEALVLETVWENGTMTVKRALYYINKNHSYAYTSIMTVLNRLVKKSFLIREKKGHSFTYTPVMERAKFIKYASDIMATELKKDFGGIIDDKPKKQTKQKKPRAGAKK